MQSIHSLHDFFNLTHAELHLYHMGRRVTPCERELLAELESASSPWPVPWQGKARLALVFRLGEMQDPLIWFLALPLDEQGHLEPAQRDAFLERLLHTLGQSAEAIEKQSATDIDNLMKDTPLAFTPTLPFQAMLHARACADLGLPASEHLEPVEDFLSGQVNTDWQALGLQGIADYSARLNSERMAELAAAIPILHNEVLLSLCYCLENTSIDTAVADALRRRGETEAQAGHLEGLCACIRAVAGAPREVTGAWFDELLADAHACGPDVLAAMAARGWEHLEHEQRLPHYLERVASCEQADFLALVRDLALIPRLRLPVLMLLRQAEKGSAISNRLQAVTAGTTGHQQD
ncbi:DUF3549 family protein [Halomonas cupida]|uniref:DUF3549 family protein n=1 Tax=Halomonas cupida TaxID=44933 RepID=UPI0039B3B59D